MEWAPRPLLLFKNRAHAHIPNAIQNRGIMHYDDVTCVRVAESDVGGEGGDAGAGNGGQRSKRRR